MATTRQQGDLFAPHRAASDTSGAVAERIAPHIHQIDAAVLDGFRRHGPHTPDEMAAQLGLDVLIVRPACTRLASAKYTDPPRLRRTGVRRPNARGNLCAELEVIQ